MPRTLLSIDTRVAVDDIIEQRHAAHITGEHLAKCAGLPYWRLHRIERGVTRPRQDEIAALYAALAVLTSMQDYALRAAERARAQYRLAKGA